MLFLSPILSGSGMYSSNQIFAQQNQIGTENIGTENEAEVEVDIEQENKCKKDTECENENEINNSLTITTPEQKHEQPVSSPCEDCFTSILDQSQIDAFLVAFSDQVEEISTLEDLCLYR